MNQFDDNLNDGLDSDEEETETAEEKEEKDGTLDEGLDGDLAETNWDSESGGENE